MVAERLGIPVAQPARLDDDVEIPVDTVVVAAYGLLIPETLLSRALWLNVHPSLLPRWRGAAPVERALMAGDARTGVTIHRTTPELDAGPIAAQEAFELAPEDDAGAVFTRAAELAATLLDGVLAGPKFTPQPADGVTYAEKITPADRDLDLDRPAQENVNRVRGLSPHIGARDYRRRPATDRLEGTRRRRRRHSSSSRCSRRAASECHTRPTCAAAADGHDLARAARRV